MVINFSIRRMIDVTIMLLRWNECPYTVNRITSYVLEFNSFNDFLLFLTPSQVFFPFSLLVYFAGVFETVLGRP